MNIAHKFNITNIVVSKRINSGAIAHVDCLERGDFTAYAQYPDLINISLTGYEVSI